MSTAYAYSPQGILSSYKALKEHVRTEDLPAETFWRDRDDRSLVVAAIQLTAQGLDSSDLLGFWKRALEAVHEAARRGANLILLPELFLGPYFCQSQEADLYQLAEEVDEHVFLSHMKRLAQHYRVVLPISTYERKNNAFYNSIVMIDADGSTLGTYRKSHIPDGTGYQEKFYFTPGDSGFKVWKTNVGKVGVAICWDQWFPEAARAMALQGADVLLYPTAIGSEPQDPTLNSADHWQRVMQGHAAANMIPVVASNRFGTEILLREDDSEKQRIHFYGKSFITDETGAIAELAEDDLCVIVSKVDTEKNRKTRAAWGLFRDRRPELYGILQTKDGCE